MTDPDAVSPAEQTRKTYTDALERELDSTVGTRFVDPPPTAALRQGTTEDVVHVETGLHDHRLYQSPVTRGTGQQDVPEPAADARERTPEEWFRGLDDGLTAAGLTFVDPYAEQAAHHAAEMAEVAADQLDEFAQSWDPREASRERALLLGVEGCSTQANQLRAHRASHLLADHASRSDRAYRAAPQSQEPQVEAPFAARMVLDAGGDLRQVVEHPRFIDVVLDDMGHWGEQVVNDEDGPRYERVDPTAEDRADAVDEAARIRGVLDSGGLLADPAHTPGGDLFATARPEEHERPEQPGPEGRTHREVWHVSVATAPNGDGPVVGTFTRWSYSFGDPLEGPPVVMGAQTSTGQELVLEPGLPPEVQVAAASGADQVWHHTYHDARSGAVDRLFVGGVEVGSVTMVSGGPDAEPTITARYDGTEKRFHVWRSQGRAGTFYNAFPAAQSARRWVVHHREAAHETEPSRGAARDPLHRAQHIARLSPQQPVHDHAPRR